VIVRRGGVGGKRGEDEGGGGKVEGYGVWKNGCCVERGERSGSASGVECYEILSALL